MRLLRGRRITAREVALWAESPFALWCEHHAPAEAREPVTAYQEHLFQMGREHEERQIAARAPGLAPIEAESEEEAAALALDAMRAGAPLVAQAALLHDDLGGRVDMLVRRDTHPSRWGAWHYEVVEVKLARRLQPKHRLQGAFYHAILGEVQGYLPRAFTLVNMDGAETRIDYDATELAHALTEVRAIRAGREVEPIFGATPWPWSAFGDERAIACDDVSLVPSVGAAMRGSLVAAGFATVRALAAADAERLGSVRGVGPARVRKLPVHAQALASGRHIRVGDLTLPTEPVEVFFDLEGTGELLGGEDDVEPMDYLIGALVRRQGEGEQYHAFVARDADGEEEMLRGFLAWLDEEPKGTLYHWHHYERTHLRKMCERFGLADAWRTKLDPRMRDLHQDASRAFAFPTHGAGLKKIAPYCGFHWRQKEVNAMESIALYLDYLRDPRTNADKLQKVRDYNEDDCIATRVVKDWLVAEVEGRSMGASAGNPLA